MCWRTLYFKTALHAHTHTHTHTHTHIHTHTHTHTHTRHTHTHIYIYLYTYIHTYIYTYIHIYKTNFKEDTQSSMNPRIRLGISLRTGPYYTFKHLNQCICNIYRCLPTWFGPYHTPVCRITLQCAVSHSSVIRLWLSYSLCRRSINLLTTKAVSH